jgi:transposase
MQWVGGWATKIEQIDLSRPASAMQPTPTWRSACSRGPRSRSTRQAQAAGFEVLPKLWIVERTFAWISRHRRLARDFERYAMTVAAFIRLAMIRIMLRRLAATALL